MSRKLRFLDFFSGIGGFHKGMEQAGHECVGFCEFDKFATASYTSMWLLTDEQRERLSALDLKKRQKEILKDEYRNGMWYSNDIRKVTGENVPKADAWCFGAPCFVAGTLITTDTGFKHIEDVRAGDMVLTHMNRYKKVLRTMKHKGQGIYSIRTRSSQLTQATGNHRFFVLSGRNDFPEWKAVQEFDGSEWIQLPQRPEKRIVCKPGQSWTNGDIWEPIDYMSCDLEREETVYNMEVEDDNSYTANYLGVHNCQSFSVAGKRAGLDGQSGLIKEVFRILGEQEERDIPEWLIYENVAGMLSSSRGFDFLAILCEMEGLGYDIEWNTFNSKDWGVPQNRVRIYTIGHLRAKGAAKVFPLEGPGGEDNLEGVKENDAAIDLLGHGERFRRSFQVFSPDGITETLDTAQGGGRGPYTVEKLGVVHGTTEPCIASAIKNVGKLDDNRHSQMNVMGVDGISCTIDTMHEPKKIAVPIDVSLKDGIVGGVLYRAP